MMLFKKKSLKIKPKHLIWFGSKVVNLTITVKYDVKQTTTKDGRYFLVAKQNGKNLLLLLIEFNLYKRAIDGNDIPEDYSYPIFYLECKNGYIKSSRYLTW